MTDTTRLWKGTEISVRNDGDTDWVDYAHIISYSMPGTPPDRIAANTASSANDTFRLGIKNRGEGVYNFFDYPDSPFIIAIATMKAATPPQTRKFKMVMPEGVYNTRIFTGWVKQNPIKGSYNQFWMMDLTLRLVKDYWWNAPITAASIAPATGPAAGGDPTIITGTGFIQGATTIDIGGNVVAAADITVNVAGTTATFDTPAHAAGLVTVTVTNPEGTTSNIVGGYTYT
jgi:hypothetical protein